MGNKIDEDAVLSRLSTKSIAKLTGFTERHVLNLHRDGVIDQVARGKYDAVAVMAALREVNSDKPTPLKAAALSLKEEQARRQKIDNDLKESRLAPIDDVHEFATLYAGYFVRSMESIRKGVGALVDGARRKTIDNQFRAARTALADKLESFKRDIAGGRTPKP